MNIDGLIKLKNLCAVERKNNQKILIIIKSNFPQMFKKSYRNDIPANLIYTYMFIGNQIIITFIFKSSFKNCFPQENALTIN